MKYRDINWSIEINGENASCDDNSLDYIAEQLQQGYTSGTFYFDDTDYCRCDRLKEKLETLIGREIDCCVENDNKGELEELLEIARENNDIEIISLIEELLQCGFEE